MAVVYDVFLRMSVTTVLLVHGAVAKPSQVYFLPDIDCNTYYSDIDGAVIKGRGFPGYYGPCNITLATGSSDPWMIAAPDMCLNNCEVTIEVFGVESGLPTPDPLMRYTCFEPVVSPLITNHSSVTVVLLHHNRTNYHFRLVFTGVKSRYGCEDFVCDSGVCISRQLTCDGVDNCFDFSDEAETGSSECIDSNPFRGENFGVLVSVVGGSIFVGLLTICCKKIRKRRRKLYEEDLLELANGPYITKYAYVYALVRTPSSTRRTQSRLKKLAKHLSVDVDEPPEF